jgi:hypothetical protein
MLGTYNTEEDYVLVGADGTTSSVEHEPWILLGRRDRKVAAFVEETGANDAGTDSQPHAVESRHETAAAQPPAERLRADVAALAALCGRPRGPMAPRNRVVSPPGSAKKKRRQRKLKPFAGRPRNASRMRQLYP